MSQSPIQNQREAFRQKTLKLMLSGDEASLSDVVRFLRDDSTLTSTVLQKATDVQAARSAPVYHLQRAVQLLGFQRVSDLLGKPATAV